MRGCLLLLACVACAFFAAGQAPRQRDTFFSGTITAFSDSEIRVSRSFLGKENVERTFQVTAETRIEGRPAAGARVTVRYVTTGAGDRALHIIVRPAPKK